MRSPRRRRLVAALGFAALAAACTSSGDSTAPETSTEPSAPAVEGPPATPDDPEQPAGDSTPSDSTPSGRSPANQVNPEPTVMSPANPPPSITPSTSAPNGRSDEPSCVSNLSIRARAALLVWPAVYADNWPAAIDTVRANDVGGVLLMSQRGLDAGEIRGRLAELEAASRHGLIVSTDEEGGDVQRLPGLGELASQRTVSRESSPEDAADLVAAHGAAVRSVGVDLVLGPVVDVEPNFGEVPIQPSRLFDGGPDRVADFASAYVTGWERAGLFATLKHFPGHGAASGDTHISAGVTPSLDDLAEFDLLPYDELAGQATDAGAAVMIGHLTVPGLTDGVPATRSPAAVTYVREDLGYGDALLITDALGMAAVGIPEPEASVLALAAGIDAVLFTMTSQTDEIIDALEQAVIDDRIDAEHLDRAAAKVMNKLGRDGHTCDGNR